MPKLFGREPAAVLAFAAVVIKLIAAFAIHISPEAQSGLNAVLAAGVGVWVAVVVHDGLSAAVYGFAQAALALAVGFGLHMTSDNQALLLSAVTIGLAMWTRTQVTAPASAPRRAAP